MSEQKQREDRVGELLDQLTYEGRLPSAEGIIVRTETFERRLLGLVFPFVGLNAVVLGTIALANLGNARRTIVMAIGGAAIAAMAWITLRLKCEGKSLFGVHHYVAAAWCSLLILPLALTGDSFAARVSCDVVFVGACALLLALARAGRLPASVLIMVALYDPLIIASCRGQWAIERYLLGAFTLVPFLALSLRRRWKGAAVGAAVAVVAFAALQMPSADARDPFLLTLLIVFLVLVGWYERLIRGEEHSDFRRFMGQGLTVLVLYLVVYALHVGSADSALTLGSWAGLTTIHQLISARRDVVGRPSRAGWIGLVLLIWLLSFSDGLGAERMMLALLALGAAFQITAQRLRSRFLSTLGLLPVILTGILSGGFSSLSNPVGTTSSDFEMSTASIQALVFVALLLTARRALPAPEMAWWTGFVKREHVEWIRWSLVNFVGRPLARIPLVGLVIGWARDAWTWIRHLKTGDERLGFDHAILVVAHAFGAAVASRQLGDLAGAWGFWPEWVVILRMAVWPLWGAFLIGSGVRRGRLFERMLGVALVLVPVIQQATQSQYRDQLPIAYLLLVVGLAMAVAGVFARRLPEPREPTPEQASINP